MEWYFVVPIVATWVLITYVWVAIGPHIMEDLVEGQDGLNGLLYWLGVMACVLSWPLAAFIFEVSISWLWWLVMIDIIGLPRALVVTANNIKMKGYTYSSKSRLTKLAWTIWLVLATILWPLQLLPERPTPIQADS